MVTDSPGNLIPSFFEKESKHCEAAGLTGAS